MNLDFFCINQAAGNRVYAPNHSSKSPQRLHPSSCIQLGLSNSSDCLLSVRARLLLPPALSPIVDIGPIWDENCLEIISPAMIFFFILHNRGSQSRLIKTTGERENEREMRDRNYGAQHRCAIGRRVGYLRWRPSIHHPGLSCPDSCSRKIL